MLAPVIVFAFNRLNVLTATIEALKANDEATQSDLFVYVDGPRPGKEGETEKVEAVRSYVKTITGFRTVTCRFAESNKGLANSIIGGTTEVISDYGRVIVVEDDLRVSRSFLRYMNQMLDLYEGDERVMQVSGYSSRLKRLKDYPYDAYLSERAHSWSWGTWKDRWETVDWQVKDFDRLASSWRMRRAFKKRGSDLFKMLDGYMTGKNNSWYIRFNYSMHRQGRYSVQPVRSLVENDGFGADATHCNNYNRYKIDFEDCHEGGFNVPQRLQPVETIMTDCVRYWSFRYRLYGLFRTILMRIGNKLHR